LLPSTHLHHHSSLLVEPLQNLLLLVAGHGSQWHRAHYERMSSNVTAVGGLSMAQSPAWEREDMGKLGRESVSPLDGTGRGSVVLPLFL
ncbi:hypothetical protein Droror1_Dr00025778, partial [Drosera rotundifolia]